MFVITVEDGHLIQYVAYVVVFLLIRFALLVVLFHTKLHHESLSRITPTSFRLGRPHWQLDLFLVSKALCRTGGACWLKYDPDADFSFQVAMISLHQTRLEDNRFTGCCVKNSLLSLASVYCSL